MSIWVIIWDNQGEASTVRERRIDALYDTAPEAMQHIKEASELGVGSYLSMRRVDDEAAAKALEIIPRSGNDQMWDRMEEAMDRADFEAVQ